MTKEFVDHPQHYNQGNIECIDAMVSAFGIEATMNFCHLNSFKYNWRCMDKNKSPDKVIEDIDKSIWYMKRMKKLYKQLPTNNNTEYTCDFEQYINRL